MYTIFQRIKKNCWLLVFFLSTSAYSQVLLEYREDSLIITDPAFLIDTNDYVFSNKAGGKLFPYKQELRHLGLQYRNHQKIVLTGNINVLPEPDSLCRADSCYDRTWYSSPVIGVEGKGTVLCMESKLFKADNTYSIASIALFDYGHILISKNTVVDLVYPRYGNYTRQIWVFGDGTGTLELEEGLIADRSAMGTTNTSFGSVRLSKVNFITHNTEAIPHYFMPDDKNPSLVLRNAHLVFENEPGTRWIVRSNDQVYNGGIQVYEDVEIVTEKKLTLDGWVNHWPTKKYYDYGGIIFYKENAKLTKSGKDSLVFDCDMAFNKGAKIIVNEGAVSFKKDPYRENILYPSDKFRNGQHLSVRIEGGTLSLESDTVRLDTIFIGKNGTLSMPLNSCLRVNHLIQEGTVIINASNCQQATYQVFNPGITIDLSKLNIVGMPKKGKLSISKLQRQGIIECVE